MKLVGRPFEIAVGRSGLPLEKVRAYRRLFQEQGYALPPLVKYKPGYEPWLNGSDAPEFEQKQPETVTDCLHRLEILGQEPCSCGAVKKIDVFSCPIHKRCCLTERDRKSFRDADLRSLIRSCEKCPDRQTLHIQDRYPRINKPRRMKWVAAVTTAPRKDPTLRRCVESMLNAGWSPIIYAEPGTDLSGLPSDVEIIHRPRKFGCWHNWREASIDLLDRFPDADAIMTVQDDTVFHPQALDFADDAFWPEPPEKVGFVSLYTPMHYSHTCQLWDSRGTLLYEGGNWWNATQRANKDKRLQLRRANKKPDGRYQIVTQSLWGACALVFPRESLRKLVYHPIALNWRGAGKKKDLPPEEIRNSDTAIGLAIRKMGLSMHWYVPSLATHIARHSTLGHGDNSGRRGAPSYDPQVDLFDVLKGEIRCDPVR